VRKFAFTDEGSTRKTEKRNVSCHRVCGPPWWENRDWLVFSLWWVIHRKQLVTRSGIASTDLPFMAYAHDVVR